MKSGGGGIAVITPARLRRRRHSPFSLGERGRGIEVLPAYLGAPKRTRKAPNPVKNTKGVKDKSHVTHGQKKHAPYKWKMADTKKPNPASVHIQGVTPVYQKPPPDDEPHTPAPFENQDPQRVKDSLEALAFANEIGDSLLEKDYDEAKDLLADVTGVNKLKKLIPGGINIPEMVQKKAEKAFKKATDDKKGKFLDALKQVSGKDYTDGMKGKRSNNLSFVGEALGPGKIIEELSRLLVNENVGIRELAYLQGLLSLGYRPVHNELQKSSSNLPKTLNLTTAFVDPQTMARIRSTGVVDVRRDSLYVVQRELGLNDSPNRGNFGKTLTHMVIFNRIGSGGVRKYAAMPLNEDRKK